MDFFEQQARAHKKTRVLVFYFALAVTCIIALIYGVALFVNAVYASKSHHHNGYEPVAVAYWNPQLLGLVALGTVAVILGGSAYKISELSGGGSALAESLGARLVSPGASDPDERKLLNVVEEMSIASGVPMPQVYLMHWEDGINAFAAGHSTSDAAITVTRGCMKILTRDELQGVIGHEFSHILNGDMRMNIRLVGILFGILCIASFGRILMQTRGRNNGLPIAIGLMLFLIGSVGAFFGRLIQAAVSRQREFLADASSVQFTRNPDGIGGALKKIGGLGETGSRLQSPHANEVSHMFFANGVSEPFFGLLETHPPLMDRIRAIDPNFDGTFPEVRYTEEEMLPRDPAKARREPAVPDLLQTVLGGAVIASGGGESSTVIKPRTVLPNLGNPTPLHLKYAEELRNSLPEELKAAARAPGDAMALVYAMLLSHTESVRSQQLGELAGHASAELAAKTNALFPAVAQTTARARLPLVNLALPALRQMDAGQYRQFSQTLQWLINSDGQVEMFEFVLQKVVLRHLDSHFNGARKGAVQYYTLKPLVPDCAVVLSALAHVGTEKPEEIQKAFGTGAPYVYAPDGVELALLSVDQCGIESLDAALNRLALAVPVIKKNLINACAHVIGSDGVIVENEAELLRAISDTLDCPIPPLGVSETD
ncbi:MAG TPA: M48 family metallopeptidase [Verrucomicrobiae bacterium]